MADDDLIPWLRTQLDAAEASTRTLLYWAQQTILTLQDPKLLGKRIPGWHDWPDVERMATERLAEVDAKRRILDDLVAHRLDPSEPDGGWEAADAETDGMASSVVRLLALPYADRPGYREEWKP